MIFSRIRLISGMEASSAPERIVSPFGAPARWGLSILSGLLMALSFPRPGWGWLAWAALIPLLCVITTSKPRAGFGYAYLTGLVFFTGLLYWVSIFGYAPVIALAAIQALYIGLFGALSARAIQGRRGWPRILIPAILWAAIEWLRSLGPLGFTWGGLAYSQAPYPSLIRIASITGPWGVSFLILLVNGALADFAMATVGMGPGWVPPMGARPRASWRLALVAVVALLSGGLGLLQQNADSREGSAGRESTIAIIQGNRQEERDVIWTPERVDNTVATYLRLSRKSLQGDAKRPELIIWPETAVPAFLLESPSILQQITAFSRDNRISMLIGGSSRTPDGRILNTQFLFSPEGKLVGRYSKRHLVPMGEYVPWRKHTQRFLMRWGIRDYDYAPGPRFETLPFSKGKLGVSICFESIFPQISRIFAKQGAQLLVIVTNDAWYGRSPAAEQHAQMATLRAVENGRWLARAATSGISEVVTPAGRAIGRTGLYEERVVTQTVAFRKKLTLYTRFGDWFAIICALIGLGLTLRRPASRYY